MDGHTRAPAKSREWYEYWDEEERRCLNGYSVAGTSITGLHYYYLNYWQITGLSSEQVEAKGFGKGPAILKTAKGLIRPRFTDFDHEFFWQLERCFEEGKDGLWLKRRQVGMTMKTSCVNGYSYTFVPGSDNIIVAGQQKYAKHNFDTTYSGLLGLARTPFYRNRLVDDKSVILSGWRERVDGAEVERGYHSRVEMMIGNDPQSLVGRTPRLVLFEEVGKFPGFLDVKAYIDPGMISEGVKTGFNLLFGTGGEDDNDSISEVEEAFYKPDQYNLYSVDNIWDPREEVMDDAPDLESRTKCCFFIPGQKFLFMDKDGNSDEERGLKWIDEEREKKKGGRNYLQQVTQFPKCPSEALLIPEGGVFNIVRLRAQRASILRDPKLRDIVVRGELKWIWNGGSIAGVEWEDDANGRFRRIEEPFKDKVGKIPEGLYVAGTDSYDIDQTVSSNGSLGSCHMFKTFHSASTTANMFVCSVTERPATAAEFWDDTIKLCLYYGGAKNLVEYSNKLIGEHYVKKGFAYLLKDRPEIAYAMQKTVGPQNRWGVDPATKPFWIRKLADYVEEYAHLIYDARSVDKLIRYRNKLPNGKPYNCDDTIAMALAVTHAQDVVALVSEESDERPFGGLSYVVRGGRIHRSGW